MLKAGQVVRVFDNPITGDGLEGKAQLIEQSHHDDGDGLSIWFVEFLDAPEKQFQRAVNEANA